MGRSRGEDARATVGNAHPPLLQLRGGVLMATPRRFWLPVAVLLALAGCRDATAPRDDANPLAEVVSPSTAYADLDILQQSPTAPPLETYQVSFWARKDRASTVVVNYQPAAGESVGLPFLRFDIPRGGLTAGPNRPHLGNRDSVFVTLTIDPQSFSVAFEPTGVVFSRRRPATLAIWYGNADPDLNGDGAVNAADQTLAAQLAIWGRPDRPAPWLKTASQSGQQWVWTSLYHFSEYAVSWSWSEYAVSW